MMIKKLMHILRVVCYPGTHKYYKLYRQALIAELLILVGFIALFSFIAYVIINGPI